MYREARELFKVTVKQGAYTAKDGVVILCILEWRKSEHEIYDFVMVSEVMYHRAHSDAFHQFHPILPFLDTDQRGESCSLDAWNVLPMDLFKFLSWTWHGRLWKVWDADSGNLDCRLMGHIGTVAGPDTGKLAKPC